MPTPGFHIGRLGAVAERDRHRRPLVGQGIGERGGIAAGVEGQRADGADGLGLAFQADRVIAHGGLHGAMVEELFEHIHGDPGIGVTLSVGVAKGVGGDQRPVEGGGRPVGAEQLAVDGGDLAHPRPKRHTNTRGRHVTERPMRAQHR